MGMLGAPFAQVFLENNEKLKQAGVAAQQHFVVINVSNPDMLHVCQPICLKCCCDFFQVNAGEAAALQGSNSEKKLIGATHVQAQVTLFGCPF